MIRTRDYEKIGKGLYFLEIRNHPVLYVKGDITILGKDSKNFVDVITTRFPRYADTPIIFFEKEVKTDTLVIATLLEYHSKSKGTIKICGDIETIERPSKMQKSLEKLIKNLFHQCSSCQEGDCPYKPRI